MICWQDWGVAGLLMQRFRRKAADLWADAKGPMFAASREVLVGAIITLTPVWAGVLISLVFTETRSLSDAVVLNTERGDLFILATAIVAPSMLYITIEKGRLPKPFSIHFPAGTFFMLATLLIFAASAILFSVKRIHDSNLIDAPYSSDNIYSLSIFLYSASIIIALSVTFIKSRLEQGSPELFQENDRNFTREWINRDDDAGRT